MGEFTTPASARRLGTSLTQNSANVAQLGEHNSRAPVDPLDRGALRVYVRAADRDSYARGTDDGYIASLNHPRRKSEGLSGTRCLTNRAEGSTNIWLPAQAVFGKLVGRR